MSLESIGYLLQSMALLNQNKQFKAVYLFKNSISTYPLTLKWISFKKLDVNFQTYPYLKNYIASNRKTTNKSKTVNFRDIPTLFV